MFSSSLCNFKLVSIVKAGVNNKLQHDIPVVKKQSLYISTFLSLAKLFQKTSNKSLQHDNKK